MPIYKNYTNSINLNLDSHHEKILSSIEKEEKLLPNYLDTLASLKIELSKETNIDKKLEIKDKIQYYKLEIKR